MHRNPKHGRFRSRISPKNGIVSVRFVRPSGLESFDPTLEKQDQVVNVDCCDSETLGSVPAAAGSNYLQKPAINICSDQLTLNKTQLGFISLRWQHWSRMID